MMVPIPVSLRPGTPVSSISRVSLPSTSASSQRVMLMVAVVSAAWSVTEPDGVM